MTCISASRSVSGEKILSLSFPLSIATWGWGHLWKLSLVSLGVSGGPCLHLAWALLHSPFCHFLSQLQDPGVPLCLLGHPCSPGWGGRGAGRLTHEVMPRHVANTTKEDQLRMRFPQNLLRNTAWRFGFWVPLSALILLLGSLSPPLSFRHSFQQVGDG